MKRFFYFAIAAIALVAVSCDKDKKGGDIDWSQVTVNGFYVAGPATGSDEIKADCVMAAGFNEVDKAVREGMYEKYIVLEGGKDFYLLYNDGGEKTQYGADLQEFVTPLEEVYNDNPEKVLKGKMIAGEGAPTMKVEKTGLYHIVLDINKAGDLKEPQILLLDASDFGVRGGMNGWGFTSSDPKVTEFSNDGVTFTFKNQELAKNGEFKFSTGNYWKVTLDDAGKVKAEVSLAAGMTLNGDNIKVEKGGLYDITLNFKLAQGSFDKCFSYTAVCTQESSAPETMYMNGGQWGGDSWDWGAETIVELVPVHSAPGFFWCTRWFDHTKEFKFCAVKAWNGDFGDNGNNCKVDADGFYTILVDGNSNSVQILPAEVYGIGDAWGDDAWDFDKPDAVPFVADGQVMKATVTNTSSAVRVATKVVTGDGWYDWWKTEFVWFDGKIAYRGAGNDQERVAVEAGQVITIDFNAGTVEVGAGFEPAIVIDGDLSDWDAIEGVTGESVSAAFKATSDSKNIYLYYKRTTENMEKLWDGNGYVYLCFDTDNNPATGVELWGNGPYEMVLVAYPYAESGHITVANAGAAAPESCSVAAMACAGAVTEDGVAVEFSIPRADLLAIPAEQITLWAWSNKGGTKLELHCTL